jgi:hypothetical protein
MPSADGRSASSCPASGIQVFGDRDGLLGSGRPANICGKVDGRVTRQLKITGKEWEAFIDDVWLTRDKFKVPAEEQAELRAIVNSTRSDIVVARPWMRKSPRHSAGSRTVAPILGN